MSYQLGIIAEDESDVDVLRELAFKVKGDRRISVRRFVGHGCGKIRSKCLEWANALSQQGCEALIVAHDLDDNDLPTLRAQLRTALGACPMVLKTVVIPVHEIEAWLLSDHRAILQAMRLRKTVNRISNPEAILRAKERLEEIIYLRSEKRKRYISTVHNRMIAARTSLHYVRRCRSFVPLEQFLRHCFTT